MTRKFMAEGKFGHPSAAFRGDRHQPNFWKSLLPKAQAKLVADGYFTKDGRITDKGILALKEGLFKHDP